MKTAWPNILLAFFVGTTAGVVLQNRVLSVGARTGADGSPKRETIAANWQAPDRQVTDAAQSVSTKAETLSSAPVAETGSPRLVVDNAIYNFGERESGEVVEHVFSVKNEGTATLKVERVQTSCGCTAAKLSSSNIAPGKEVQLAVKLNLAVQKGPQEKDITLHTNDANNPQFRLSLVGTAVPRVTLIPERAEMTATDVAAPGSFDLKVVAERGLKFNVKGVKTSGAQVTAEVKAVKPGEEFSVTVHLKPPLPVGQFHGWVHLLTDNRGEYAVIGIPVIATVLPSQALNQFGKPVSVSPSQPPANGARPQQKLTASSPE